MKKGELKKQVKNDLHVMMQAFIDSKAKNGELITGAITVTAPNYLKVKLVDEEYKSYTFTITIQEGK